VTTTTKTTTIENLPGRPSAGVPLAASRWP
jgi:hypothetical protein